MSLSGNILHLVTWYPTSDTDIDGIFIRRHIELLAKGSFTEHIVIRKKQKPSSVFEHLKALLGIFNIKSVGAINVLTIPAESTLFKRYFWRWRFAIEIRILKNLINKYKPILFHLHVVYGFGKEAVWLKKKMKIPFIVTEHMAPFPFEWITDKETEVFQPINFADRVIAVSEAQAKQIFTTTGKEVSVIPNVVRSEEFIFQPFSLQSPLQLILVGIYDARKGADYLIRTMPAFLEHYPNCILHLVGNASEERMFQLKQLIKEKNIDSSISFHGCLTAKELNVLFGKCSFYVCTSEWESFGLTMLEALFSGLPVLSTDCGGVHEYIVDNENGMIIENDRIETTLLRGMLKMVECVSFFDRNSISDRARSRFESAVIKEKYLSIYKSVAPKAFL